MVIDKKRALFVFILVAALITASIITYICLNRKTITVYIGKEQFEITTYEDTVDKALKDNDIPYGLKDKIQPLPDAKVKDKDVINIKKAVNIKVLYGGKEIEVQTAEDSILNMLQAEKIEIDEDDKVLPSKDIQIAEGLIVTVIKVDIETLDEIVPIKYKETIEYNSRINNTERKVKREGKNGTKKVTTKITYEDGTEVSREVVSEEILEPAVDKIIVAGTYPYMPVSRGGEAMTYSKVFKAKATAYWAIRGVGKTYTASGRKAVRDPEGYSTIAVDPTLIPYGTKLFVEGYGFAIAADTGSAIKGEFVDVYFNTLQEARKWGLKYVNVYILK
ncbi:cell wall-binding protein YocH precursor [Oxobacter pfennigii]|uniref:Cell wall-binding protein YocH n=1 Tax=Oxobacter pfennigii TaxID=36849 RepID=A0A0P8YA01_9CLOT|nr:3D domain-containing protein [Oxobacter pfennigii]KPU43764.1 cell wall-binding protein YocH precursor [Oxobacter pfennigii]